MLRKTRVALAFVCIVLVTLLFLDFTGTARYAFGWLAKIQFWPAVLALNIGVILALLVLTFLFGRVYCSIICPFGIFQDVISRISGRFNKRRFRYSPALSWLRYTVLAIFVGAFSVSSFVVGAGVARAFVSLLSPYSAYGRIANGLFAPVYRVGNNLLAHFAERIDSYAFYSVDVIDYKGVMILVVPLVTLVVLAVLAWRNGRTYCNTICPVGTVLGFVSNYSLFKIRIDADQCNQCGLCERNCKASCIDSKTHTIDYSRCVACMNCMDGCRRKAISFVPARKKQELVSADHRVACMEAAPSKSLSRERGSGRTVHSRRHFFYGYGFCRTRFGGEGARQEGRRWSCEDKRQGSSRSCDKTYSSGSNQRTSFCTAVYCMPTLCFGLPEPRASSFRSLDDTYATRNGI